MTQESAQSIGAPWERYFETLAAEVGGRVLSARPQVRNSGGRASFFVDVKTDSLVRPLYVRAGRDMIPDGFAHEQLGAESG
jgi:hypothetical protein